MIIFVFSDVKKLQASRTKYWLEFFLEGSYNFTNAISNRYNIFLIIIPPFNFQSLTVIKLMIITINYKL